MTKKISLNSHELQFSYSRSSGAGGQNVNKLNTKVTMQWDLENSPCCSDEVKQRFREKFKRYIFDGVVIIHGQRFRSQHRNKEDCIDKLQEMLNSVARPPKKRKATLPTRASIKKRLEQKKQHGQKKKWRQEKY